MFIYRLSIIGLLLFGAICAQSYDPTYYSQNNYEDNANEAGDSYWWMSKGSPFKRSYEAAVSGQASQNNFDFASNPFLNGRPFQAANSVADSQASAANPYARAQLYSAPGYLPPVQPTRPAPPPPPPPPPPPAPRVPCGGNRACVSSYQCVGGYVDASQVSVRNPECNPAAGEVCCNIRVPPPPTQPPPPPPPPTQPPAQQCLDRNSICVAPYQCRNGAVSKTNGFSSKPFAQACYAPEVCCTVENIPAPSVITTTYRPPQTQRPYITPPPPAPKKPFQGDQYIPPYSGADSSPGNEYLPPDQTINTVVTVRPPVHDDQKSPPIIPCPAATNCTDIQFCASDGSISKTPVILTKEQETYRVPLSDCRDLSKGIQAGKCCRDKDYTDPWPTSVLGQYRPDLLGFDTGSYNPEKYRNGNNVNGKQPSGISQRLTKPPVGQGLKNVPISPNAIPNVQKPYQPQPYQPQPYQPQTYQTQQHSSRSPFPAGPGVCVTRDQQAQPRGQQPNEAGFGEFPWQAMVLRESTKSILCGGAIIEGNLVATAAHCVEGLRPSDVLIKAGEWKLGSTEEPKPFQTVRVKTITAHPAYQPTTLESDVALLHLESNLNFDKHIGPICIEQGSQELSEPIGNCVTSGWGKDVIKYHVAGALPHAIDISPLPQGECQASLPGYNPGSSVCGRAQDNVCDADVGSALACTDGSGKYTLRGIYAGESGCGSNQVAQFVKMDANWVQSVKIGCTSYRTTQVLCQPQPAGSALSPQVQAYSVPSTQAPIYLPPGK